MNYSKEFLRKIYLLISVKTSRLVFILLSALLLSFLDVFGLALIVPFIDFIKNSGSQNESINQVLNFFEITNFNNQIIFFSFILFLLFFIKAILAVVLHWFISSTAFINSVNLRIKLISNMTNEDYSLFLKNGSSHYLQILTLFANNFSAKVFLPLLKTASDIIIILIILLQ